MPRPLLSINLESVQATTQDLAALLGLSLAEPSKQKPKGGILAGLPQHPALNRL